jgi:hypothetical protein
MLNTYLIKQQNNGGKGVTLVSLNHTYIHYHTIELKLNVNLQKEGENGNFRFIDALQGLTSSFIGDFEHEDTLLYASPLVSRQDKARPTYISVWKPTTQTATLSEDLFEQITKDGVPDCLIIDYLNPLLYTHEDAEASIYKTIQKLYQLTRDGPTTVVVAMHGCSTDVTSMEQRLANSAEHLADVVFRVSGLPTGYSKDVHGQVEVVHKRDAKSYEAPKRVKLHYKTFEHQVKLFAPGFGIV